jgi:hypothetical protein
MMRFHATSLCLSLAIWCAVTIGGSLGVAVSASLKTKTALSPGNDPRLIQRFLDILEHPVPFHDADEEDKCKVTIATSVDWNYDYQIALQGLTCWQYFTIVHLFRTENGRGPGG